MLSLRARSCSKSQELWKIHWPPQMILEPSFSKLWSITQKLLILLKWCIHLIFSQDSYTFLKCFLSQVSTLKKIQSPSSSSKINMLLCQAVTSRFGSQFLSLEDTVLKESHAKRPSWKIVLWVCLKMRLENRAFLLVLRQASTLLLLVALTSVSKD